MKVFFFLIITLLLLFVTRSNFAQSASMEKVVLLKCKGNLNVSQRVDDRRERSVNEALFAAEVRYKADEPKSLLVDLSDLALVFRPPYPSPHAACLVWAASQARSNCIGLT